MKELSLQNCRIDARYDIQNILGQGSYAEIYVARDNMASIQSPHRLVVIKALNVFLQDDLDSDLEKTLVENFQNEAIALDRVRHPNIISRLGHGTARDLRGTVFHYLILEYLPGGDLAKLRQKQSLQINQAFSYLEQVCAGLAHAHKCGIIHRDIKPQNLLLTHDHKIVKIADFGVARFSHSDSPITRVGTNMYAPPEHSPVFSDEANTVEVKELTPAADIYSLAKSAYVLLTGESPRRFTNLPINDLPHSISAKGWSNGLLRVLNKATQNNPNSRYQTVDEFWQDLAKIKLLTEAEETEHETVVGKKISVSPQPSISKEYTSKTPLLPEFSTSDNFKTPMTEEKTPHFVVKLSNEPPAKQPTQIFNEKNQIQFEIPQNTPKPKKSFFRKIIYSTIFLIILAAGLFATQYYLRTGSILPQIFVKQQNGIANNDVNLRVDGNVNSAKIGLVPRGSKIRILNNKDNWMEIAIIEFGRPKESPTDAEQGWVNGRYIDIQE